LPVSKRCGLPYPNEDIRPNRKNKSLPTGDFDLPTKSVVMCGFLFLDQIDSQAISEHLFSKALQLQAWRGPDAQHLMERKNGFVRLGHNRLSIIDPVSRSDQPMVSSDGRFVLVFNGEIYNHLALRKNMPVAFSTTSDTETILVGYALWGDRIFSMLDGMYAIVIYDTVEDQWIAARDPLGVKPLFIHRSQKLTLIGSEPCSLASLCGASLCPQSVEEWKLVRRPVPGRSFFRGIDEVIPGQIMKKRGETQRFWRLAASDEPYSQERFEELMDEAIRMHEMSDVRNVSLLSGGLDSAVITAVSSVSACYTIGLPGNSEINEASETAKQLGRQIVALELSPEEMVSTWRDLTVLRGEPIGVPNEAMIYAICRKMEPDEKVVLTGEGADELLFGYDQIFRWASEGNWQGTDEFLRRYGYSTMAVPTDRLRHYTETLRGDKTTLQFVEDFFFGLHLPGLLRRMDFASMAASKEARVPFVTKALVNYMYRRPGEIKISPQESKIPLRRYAQRLGLVGALHRKKIGFSATIGPAKNKYDEYSHFQSIVTAQLGCN